MATQQLAPTIPTCVRVQTLLPGTAVAAPMCRIFLRQHLYGHVPLEQLRTAELLTTELVTTAFLRAAPAIQVTVTRHTQAIRVTVQDRNPGAEPAARHDLADGYLDECRHAMMLIARLADDFGWSRTPDDSGQSMWFAVSVTPRG